MPERGISILSDGVGISFSVHPAAYDDLNGPKIEPWSILHDTAL